jgi:hypothetical protein
MSFAESVTNVVVGYGVAVVTQMLVFPLFGMRASVHDNLVIGVIFKVKCSPRPWPGLNCVLNKNIDFLSLIT